jgi:hypothetical protein
MLSGNCSFFEIEIIILAKIINNLPTAVAAFSSPAGDSESSRKFLHQINKRTNKGS